MIQVFNPVITNSDINAVVHALKKGEISGSYGQTIKKFEDEFAQYCGCKYGVTVSNGTAALHLAVAAANIGKGDEVLISSSTNIATALAVVNNGAIPIPVDSNSTTWNLDIDKLESLITPQTKAIIPVHLYGQPVDMIKVMKIARKHHLLVIEDCAESHGATFQGKMTGSFGAMACFSFYANKVITTGEGGMVITNNKELANRMYLLRNLGFTTPRFRHEVVGYNFRMTGFQAAMGLNQLKRIEKIIRQKIKIANLYNKYLQHIEQIQLPFTSDNMRNIYWMYAIRIKENSKINRDQLMEKLMVSGIESRTFFYPMNLQPCLLGLKEFKSRPNPIAEMLWHTGLYLPSSTTLTEKQIKFICNLIEKYVSSN